MSAVAVITFVRTYWKLAALGALCILLAVQTVRLSSAKNTIERREIDIRELKAAAVEAERLNKAQVQRIEADQQRITDDVEADLTARLERLRSELRAKASQGAAGRPKANPPVPSSPGATQEAGVCISTEQFLLGAEYEEKLDQWINLYEQQQGVVR